MLKIRRANIDDIEQIFNLYHNTITSVNKKDYNQKQIIVWTKDYNNTGKWSAKIREQYFFVADVDETVIGFGSITDKGYVDYIFVDKFFQGQGIATQILKALEEIAKELKLDEIWAHVSITARPFFKSKGFELTKTFTTKIDDVEFEDSIMTKKRMSAEKI